MLHGITYHSFDTKSPIRNKTLQWRNNGRNSVSNHQSHDCFLNRLFRRRSKKTSKLRVTGLCTWNSPGIGEFAAQMASNAEYVSIPSSTQKCKGLTQNCPTSKKAGQCSIDLFSLKTVATQIHVCTYTYIHREIESNAARIWLKISWNCELWVSYNWNIDWAAWAHLRSWSTLGLRSHGPEYLGAS